MLTRLSLRIAGTCPARLASTSAPNDAVAPIIENRNPRNLEMMGIALKPQGYHLETPGRNYWHKLKLVISKRHVTANIVHYTNGCIISASTREWAIKKQLYRGTDTAAYSGLGKVLARRCLQAGLIRTSCAIKAAPGSKAEAFVKAAEEGGLILSEVKPFRAAQPWDTERPPKPWEVPE